MNVAKHLSYCCLVDVPNYWDIFSYYNQLTKSFTTDARTTFAEYVFFELHPLPYRFRYPRYRWWLISCLRAAQENYRKSLKVGFDIKPLVFQAFDEPQSLPDVQHLDLGDLRIVNCSNRSIAIRRPGFGLRSQILPSGDLERESFRELWANGSSPKMTVFLFPEWLELGIRRHPLTGELQNLSYHSPAGIRLIRSALDDGAAEECRFEFQNLTPKQVWRTGDYLAVRVPTEDGYRWMDFP